MNELSKTDKFFTILSAVLIILSVIIFMNIPNQNFFIYIFVAVLLMITAITSIVMAGFTYSIGKDKKEVEFTGKKGLIQEFTKTSEEDRTLLLGLIAFLAFFLITLDLLFYYKPF